MSESIVARALIVLVTPNGEQTALIVSKVEKHPERLRDYDAVIAAFRNAEFALIFGPGEDKTRASRKGG